MVVSVVLHTAVLILFRLLCLLCRVHAIEQHSRHSIQDLFFNLSFLGDFPELLPELLLPFPFPPFFLFLFLFFLFRFPFDLVVLCG